MVSREEQEKQNLLPVRRGNLVLPDRGPVQIQQMQPHSVDLAVTHPATQEVIVTTSATDRARGFQMIITPISLVVGVLAVLVYLAFDNELFTLWAFLLFWVIFAFVYVIGWVLTAVATPEFVSWYSARRQWNLIDREQQERWDHYKWQAGREDKRRDWWADSKPIILLCVLAWMFITIVFVVSTVWG